jgi:hypothetical protein
MKASYTDEEFKVAKENDLLPCECYVCGNTFYKRKRVIKRVGTNSPHAGKYCSNKCQSIDKNRKIDCECTNCGKSFKKTAFEIKKSKSGNHFCSRSCAASYNNRHKSTGTRRSKLEVWLEEQLIVKYPDLDFSFNQKDVIGSELDIYISSLNLAFELNGIFHYEPIYGEDKLQQIQENDSNKFQLCQKHNISLCVIDTSGQNYFKVKSSKKYLDIICQIIDTNL